jgi:hypothetical protein
MVCFSDSSCQGTGLDGVEIHAAHSYLLASFLSSTSNRRKISMAVPLRTKPAS